MNGHIEAWLEAYLDGELPARQVQQVETHLAGCRVCRDRLARQRTLAALLQTDPPPAGRKSEGQFAAEVGLRLPRQQFPTRTRPRVLRLGWLLAPVGLLVAAAFIQAVFILSTLVQAIPGAGGLLLGDAATQTPARLPGAVGNLLGALGIFNVLDWGWLTGFAALGIVSLLAMGWLASWWVRSRSQGI